MAFDSFRAQDQHRPRRQRRLAFFLVAVFHGVLIAAGVVYSYWHVDELTPPTLRVTFMSAAPPPPPPPPPPAGGGGARAKKVAVKPKVVEPVVPAKPPEIVQPPEKPRPIKKVFRQHEDEYVEDDNAKAATGSGKGKGTIAGDGDDDGEEDGVAGGVKGGVIGGTIGGSGPPAAPRMMPPQFGALQKQSGDDPCFPPALNHGGMGYVVGATICVSVTGSVESVSLTKASDPRLNDCVTNTVRTWRFRPMRSGGLAAPFCYTAKFEFNSHP